MNAITATPAPDLGVPGYGRPAVRPGGYDRGGPDQYSVSLRAFPGTSRVCRNMALVTAWSWGADRDDAAMIGGELAANAIRETLAARRQEPLPYSPRLIAFRLIRLPARMRIEVWDKAGGEPVMADPGYEAENGRGLLIVNELTGGQWGTFPPPARRDFDETKCVWAEIPLSRAGDRPRVSLPGSHRQLPDQRRRPR